MEAKSIVTSEVKVKQLNYSLLLKITVSAIALLFLAFRIDWHLFVQHLQEMNLAYVFLAFFAVVGSIIISGYKWYLLCRLHGEVSFNECFRWYYIGFFFNNFLPGSIGGDVSRIYFSSKKLGSQQAIASVTVERLFAGIALVICAVSGILFFNMGNSIWVQMVIFIGLLLVIYSFLFVKSFERVMVKLVGDKILPFYETIALYKSKKGMLLKLLVFSFLFQLFYILVSSFLFLAMEVSVPFMAQIGFISLISILTMIPVSINGIGVREGAYAFLFSVVSVAESVSIAVSLMFFVLVLIGTSIGGIIWVFEKSKEKKEHETGNVA